MDKTTIKGALEVEFSTELSREDLNGELLLSAMLSNGIATGVFKTGGSVCCEQRRFVLPSALLRPKEVYSVVTQKNGVPESVKTFYDREEAGAYFIGKAQSLSGKSIGTLSEAELAFQNLPEFIGIDYHLITSEAILSEKAPEPKEETVAERIRKRALFKQTQDTIFSNFAKHINDALDLGGESAIYSWYKKSYSESRGRYGSIKQTLWLTTESKGSEPDQETGISIEMSFKDDTLSISVVDVDSGKPFEIKNQLFLGNAQAVFTQTVEEFS